MESDRTHDVLKIIDGLRNKLVQVLGKPDQFMFEFIETLYDCSDISRECVQLGEIDKVKAYTLYLIISKWPKR